MDIQTFIQNFREAFGEKAELPLVFWYSDTQEGTAEKINGCFFKGMKTAREGGIISLNPDFCLIKRAVQTDSANGHRLYTANRSTQSRKEIPSFCAYRQDRKSERSGRCRIHSQPRYAFRTYHMGLL